MAAQSQETASRELQQTRWSSLALPATLMMWVIVVLVARTCYSPPTPLADSISDSKFSAGRAARILNDLFEDGIPHPAGSDQNAVVRTKIVELLNQFGLKTSIQESEQPVNFRRLQTDPESVWIKNIVATRDSNPKLGAVMLVAHYDSVPFGPGASDDGVGVAALLEIARMIQEHLPFDRDIIFLFSDGEEYGLLGAIAFVKENELAKRVEFVINLEARGTTGPSLMFQTSDDSLQMAKLFAKTAPHPVTSSIFEEVYKRLPNDTDFTIFRDEANYRGYNFAFIGDARKYHTPEDNVANADLASLQHHGENAWNLLKILSQLPETKRETSTAVYFDVMSQFVVVWNAQFSMLASILATLAVVLSCGLAFRDKIATVSSSLSQMVLMIGIFVGISLCVATLSFSFNLENRFQPPWVDHPTLIALAFWSSGLMVFLFIHAGLRSWSSEYSAWSMTWLAWSVWAIISSWQVVGASYLFLAPLIAAIIIRLLAIAVQRFLLCDTVKSSGHFVVANIATSVVAAVIWMPIGIHFYDGIGFSIIAVTGIRIIFMTSTLVPVAAAMSRPALHRLAWIGLAITLVSTVAAVIFNPVG